MPNLGSLVTSQISYEAATSAIRGFSVFSFSKKKPGDLTTWRFSSGCLLSRLTVTDCYRAALAVLGGRCGALLYHSTLRAFSPPGTGRKEQRSFGCCWMVFLELLG